MKKFGNKIPMPDVDELIEDGEHKCGEGVRLQIYGWEEELVIELLENRCDCSCHAIKLGQKQAIKLANLLKKTLE